MTVWLIRSAAYVGVQKMLEKVLGEAETMEVATGTTDDIDVSYTRKRMAVVNIKNIALLIYSYLLYHCTDYT